jgi:outer membrane lipoprotein SlyB
MTDAQPQLMRTPLGIAALLAGFAFAACATTSKTTTTMSIPRNDIGRTGQVVSVQQTVERVQGNPAGGALAGGAIGGIAFRSRFGAAAGAATGAILSSGSSERRAYVVEVQFDDGTTGHFDYVDYAPFGPGQRVRITSGGLAPA